MEIIYKGCKTMCGGGGTRVEPLEPHKGSVTFNDEPAKADPKTKRRATRTPIKRQSATMLTGELG